jgi:hypothetical protein
MNKFIKFIFEEDNIFTFLIKFITLFFNKKIKNYHRIIYPSRNDKIVYTIGIL